MGGDGLADRRAAAPVPAPQAAVHAAGGETAAVGAEFESEDGLGRGGQRSFVGAVGVAAGGDPPQAQLQGFVGGGEAFAVGAHREADEAAGLARAERFADRRGAAWVPQAQAAVEAGRDDARAVGLGEGGGSDRIAMAEQRVADCGAAGRVP
jgi:hypothetical protein